MKINSPVPFSKESTNETPNLGLARDEVSSTPDAKHRVSTETLNSVHFWLTFCSRSSLSG